MFDSLRDPRLFAASGDPGGREWIEGLPARIDHLCHRWGLDLDAGETRHGYHAVVVPVWRGSEPCVLKLTWPLEGAREEARALAAWNGAGMVRVLETDLSAGGLLLERLDWNRSLRDVEILEAAGIAGTLLRRLAIAAPPGFGTIGERAAETVSVLQREQSDPRCPVPRDWLDEALRLSRYLVANAASDRLIHIDLHYDNILAGTREPWLAIDPIARAGEPEAAVAELIWTRVDEVVGDEGVHALLHAVTRGARLDPELTHSWVIVRCVDYWLWGEAHGLTHDPLRCRRILGALFERGVGVSRGDCP